MATNVINNPRIDRQFVDGQGRLTQYGYSLFDQIIRRVGGTVGDIIDGEELSNAVQELRLAPAPVDLSGPLAELAQRVDALPQPSPDLTVALAELRQRLDLMPPAVDAMHAVMALRQELEQLPAPRQYDIEISTLSAAIQALQLLPVPRLYDIELAVINAAIQALQLLPAPIAPEPPPNLDVSPSLEQLRGEIHKLAERVSALEIGVQL